MTVETASPGYTQEQYVALSCLVDGDGGESRFEDKIISYTSNLGPLRQTPAVPGNQAARQLPDLSIIIRVDPSSPGVSGLRGALPKAAIWDRTCYG
jgi:hypothetical protein